MYAVDGRPSIAPEKLLRALLLQVLYTVRSERLLMEQLDYNFLFRWFVGLSIETRCGMRPCSARTGSGCWRARWRRLFRRGAGQARAHGLLSDEHFTVDGTLIEAWAGHKSFKRKADRAHPPDDPGNPSVDFHGERRRNDTHQSTTDPQALLGAQEAGQGSQAQLCRGTC